MKVHELFEAKSTVELLNKGKRDWNAPLNPLWSLVAKAIQKTEIEYQNTDWDSGLGDVKVDKKAKLFFLELYLESSYFMGDGKDLSSLVDDDDSEDEDVKLLRQKIADRKAKANASKRKRLTARIDVHKQMSFDILKDVSGNDKFVGYFTIGGEETLEKRGYSLQEIESLDGKQPKDMPDPTEKETKIVFVFKDE